MHLSCMHPVTSENYFHFTRLYTCALRSPLCITCTCTSTHIHVHLVSIHTLCFQQKAFLRDVERKTNGEVTVDMFRCSSATNGSEQSESVELSNVGLSIHDLLHVRVRGGLLIIFLRRIFGRCRRAKFKSKNSNLQRL